MPDRRASLGESLVAEGLLSDLELEKAQQECASQGKPLQHVLVEMKLISEEQMATFISNQLNVPMIGLSSYLIDPGTVELLSETMVRRYLVIPLFKIEDTLTVAMADPLDVLALDELRYSTGCNIDPVIATETDIRNAIDQHYGAKGSIEEVVRNMEETAEEITVKKEDEFDLKKLQDMAEEAPVIRLVNILIINAVKDKASDIHIEPEATSLRIRYRIDGVLYEATPPPKHLQSAIISRIKIMAGMDIAQKRVPQDGRIMVQIANRDIDLRVSMQPTIHGENAVIRILDRAGAVVDLDELGFAKKNNKIFCELIKKSHGIILVTGPTGSGKTTTLYSSLNMINSIDKNIMTVEEPVEYQMELVRQTQVDRKVGLDFATALRTILRQDPDVILVGEIRDRETAEMAVRAALTGHLVFSTLHTNDAPGAPARLLDIGVEPFLIASSTIAVLAQRLVRKICEHCKEDYTPSKELLRRWALNPDSNYTLARGRGCEKCRDSGYSGRVAIFEIMVLDDIIRSLIMERAPSSKIKEAAVKAGMTTLRQDGLRKALAKVTTLEEVARVAP